MYEVCMYIYVSCMYEISRISTPTDTESRLVVCRGEGEESDCQGVLGFFYGNENVLEEESSNV